MSGTVWKILLFMRKRPGMSTEEFRDYYEQHHAPLCATYSAGMIRYIRRYIEPHNHPEAGAFPDAYDVITELWFDDEAIYRGTLAYLTSSLMPDEIIADEKRLFDRSSFRIATVVECESGLS